MKSNSRTIIGLTVLFLTLIDTGLAQTVGIKVGYPLSNAFQTSGSEPLENFSFPGPHPKAGLTVEWSLPAGLLLETDAIYSRLNYESRTVGVDVLTNSNAAVNCWDFPILVKERFTHSAIRPYVSAGVVFRAVNASADVVTTVFPGSAIETTTRPLEFVHQATAGFAFGAGIDFKIRKLHLLPEWRFMQFQRDNFQATTNVFHSNLRQPEFLIGFQMGK